MTYNLQRKIKLTSAIYFKMSVPERKEKKKKKKYKLRIATNKKSKN